MCVVSMISDHYMERWPVLPLVPSSPFKLPKPVEITREQWEEYQELKRKAQEYDERFNQLDCVKPEVDVWEKAIKETLRQQGIIEP